MAWVLAERPHLTGSSWLEDKPLKAASLAEAIGEVALALVREGQGVASFTIDGFPGAGGRKATIFTGIRILKIKWVK